MNIKVPNTKKEYAILGVFALLTALSLFYAWSSSTATSAQAQPVAVIEAAPTAIPSPYPITPPDVSKITVSDPDAEGYTMVTGTDGAVEGSSIVAVINLNAHTIMTTTASTAGGFSVPLYAPPGSSLLIKYEIAGEHFYRNRIKRFWQEAQTSWAAATTENLNPLPGTIIHVGEPPSGDGNSQAFSSVGSWQNNDPQGWAGWWLSGTLQVPSGGDPPHLSVEPGEVVTITAQVRVTSPGINCPGSLPHFVSANINLRYMFDATGRSLPWGSWFGAWLFTPTGLPIEHEAPGEAPEITVVSINTFTCVSTNTIQGDLEVPITIPPYLEDGIYRPDIILNSNVPLGANVPLVEVWYYSGEEARLPSLRVGDPAEPRIPWSMLVDYPVNGHQGLQARENAGAFALTTRSLYPPHQVVIPRLDERSGDALEYRLEPGSIWLSSTDRRLPNPPHIPLKLPSGHLLVEVLKPDGSVDTLGPLPLQQSSVRTPSTPGGDDLHEATGQIGDLFHLTTMDDTFAYIFEQYGHHVIFVFGEVEDIYGNIYRLDGTYDVTVARILDLDPAQLPTMPYVQGDAFAPGLHVFPPMPANVSVELTHMPNSDPQMAITHAINGQANRYGYFQPPLGTDIRLETPGEFRVDITADYLAPDGTLWMGAVTWGNVVEGPLAAIEAHGRRGMDYKSDTIDDMPPWFITKNLPPDKVGLEVYYPYISGDIHWGDETPDSPNPTGSIHSVITIKDLTGANETFYNLIRAFFPRARNGMRWPPLDNTSVGLNKRLDIDEAPLFITTRSGIDPIVDPEDIDMWGYFYASSERPDVHVREILSEDGMGTPYWRFNDTYGYQIGEPADGDQEGDIKWEFGGAVFRVISETQPINEYAIYSSFWVLLPHNEITSTRVSPPFQDATGASFNGGPIMKLLGEDIDMLFLPKGVRPGDVLEVGDVIAFSGHVGPPLDSRVAVTITAPSGAEHTGVWHANKIGWLYDPTFDFTAVEPGRWTVDVSVLHDRPYIGNGVTPTSHNTGTVLGTTGQYQFYVVEPDSLAVSISSPQPGFIVWPTNTIEPVDIQGRAPAGTTTIYYTIHDKGVVMGQGSVIPDATGAFTITYDAMTLHANFPMLSIIAREGRWEGLADEVAINLLAVGTGPPQAAAITLIGEEVFVRGGVPAGGSFTIYLPIAQK
jgi:hypothetical protein